MAFRATTRQIGLRGFLIGSYLAAILLGQFCRLFPAKNSKFDPNDFRSSLRSSPLRDFVCSTDDDSIIEKVIANPSLLHQDDEMKRTILHYAVLERRIALARSLVSLGASLRIQDNLGYDVVELAAMAKLDSVWFRNIVDGKLLKCASQIEGYDEGRKSSRCEKPDPRSGGEQQ